MDNVKVETKRLKQLFFARLIGSFIFLVFLSWAELPDESNISPLIIYLVWFSLSITQGILFKFPKIILGNLLLQLSSDIFIISLLVFNSGGIISPVIFLLGVVIIIAGTQARALLVLVIAVFSCIAYLTTIYSYAAIHHQIISDKDTLHILLQTSLFFLAGGIMALIANRHASLHQEQQQASSLHRHLQELHAQVLSSMQEGIIILNHDLLVQDFNQATSEILNLTHQDIGKNIQEMIEIPSAMMNFIHENELNVFRTESRHKNQSFLLTLTRLLDDRTSWLMTIVNITETRELEQQLAKKDKLASIGQMAAMLAHEIRNPMQTIAQAVELMGLEQKSNKLEHIVTDELSRLNRLVSDILDYASPLHPHVQHIEIKKVIESSVNQVDLNNTHDIQLDITNAHLNIDPDHFRLILDNLLRNAIHASPEPASIQVTFTVNETNWTLQVRDHGQGIDKDIQGSLFEPFQTNRKKGTGLGLATVWQVCHINHWNISIDQNIEDGACFIIQSSLDSSSNDGENHG